MSTRPLISVVDDDESVRESLPDLLKECGFDAQAFSSAEEFLASDSVSRDQLLGARRRDARHDRTGSAARTNDSPPGDSHRIYHCAP